MKKSEPEREKSKASKLLREIEALGAEHDSLLVKRDNITQMYEREMKDNLESRREIQRSVIHLRKELDLILNNTTQTTPVNNLQALE